MTDKAFRMHTVTVYSFQVFDPQTLQMQLGNYKASRETIAGLAGAEHLPATAEDVPRDALDAKGRYRRVATGWGALP